MISSLVLGRSTRKNPPIRSRLNIEPNLITASTLAWGRGKTAASPGQHAKHYAPRTRAVRFETPQRGLIHIDTPDGEPNGLMAVGTIDYVKKWGRIVAMPKVAEVYAQNFYAVLRELDGMGLDTIFIEMPPDRPEWEAVRDRIVRATQPLKQFH